MKGKKLLVFFIYQAYLHLEPITVDARPDYRSGQDEVPTRTEKYLFVRSKNRHEEDRDERLASWS
jgi:hypothetical protein